MFSHCGRSALVFLIWRIVNVASGLAIVNFTNPAQAGKVNRINYTPVDQIETTFVLLKGSSDNLETIDTLITFANGGFFDWSVNAFLPTGNDYVLEIKRGDEVAYSDHFTILAVGSSDSASVAATAMPGATDATSIQATGASGQVTALLGSSEPTDQPTSRSGIQTTQTPSPTGATAPSSSPSPSTAGSSTSSLSVGAKAGIAIGAVLSITLISALAFLLGLRKRQNPAPQQEASATSSDNLKPELAGQDLPNREDFPEISFAANGALVWTSDQASMPAMGELPAGGGGGGGDDVGITGPSESRYAERVEMFGDAHWMELDARHMNPKQELPGTDS